MTDQDHTLLKKINTKLKWIVVLLIVLLTLAVGSLAGLSVRLDLPPAQPIEEIH